MEPESFDRQTRTYWLSLLISVVLIGCIVLVLRQSIALFVLLVKKVFLLIFCLVGLFIGIVGGFPLEGFYCFDEKHLLFINVFLVSYKQ